MKLAVSLAYITEPAVPEWALGARGTVMAEWTDQELRATVAAYLEMLNHQDRGEPYSKAQFRRMLVRGALNARSEASIEYRMRNISAVLDQHGRLILNGYIPAANVGEKVSEIIWSIVRKQEASPPSPTPGQASTPAARSLASGASKLQPKIIYFNVGWMKRYAGPDTDDRTIGSHGYLDAHEHGAECFNFLPNEGGRVQGYRPPGDREQTNLTRLGADRSQGQLDGVLVIWMAREPGTGRTLIVGWYRNATVYHAARDGGVDFNDERIHYSVEARVDDAVLLPPVARTFKVKSSRVSPGQGFGQKPTWYGSPEVDKRVWAYVQSWLSRGSKKAPPASKSPPKNNDPELRRKVERAAVEHATAYYKSVYGMNCLVESVEKDAKGWDLEVHTGPEPLLVEVKGLLNSGCVCELTPNEYAKMMLAKHRARYVVFVVNNALAQKPLAPVASIFEHCGGRNWQTADGRDLVITEKIGAVLTAA